MGALRVAFLQSTLDFGGHERLVESIATGLDRSRLEPLAVHLYAPGPIGKRLAAAGIPAVSGLAGGWWDPGVGARLGRVWSEHGVDAVYVADSALPLFWAGERRRRTARPRLIVGFHSTGKRSDVLQHRLANARALPVADRFVALAPSHRDYLCRALGLAADRFTVIPNGVDTRRFHPAAARDESRREAGLPAGAPLAGVVAALRPEKDHALFLRAAARVAARVPEARFALIGDGPERPRLVRAAREQGLGGAVLFLGARDDIPALMRALDLVVLSSRPVVETFPVTLLEAMSCGVPVVSTAVGSVHEIVVEGETGFLTPPGDEEALADRMLRLLLDAARRDAMGTAGRRRAERLYTVEAMVAAYERLFLEVAR